MQPGERARSAGCITWNLQSVAYTTDDDVIYIGFFNLLDLKKRKREKNHHQNLDQPLKFLNWNKSSCSLLCKLFAVFRSACHVVRNLNFRVNSWPVRGSIWMVSAISSCDAHIPNWLVSAAAFVRGIQLDKNNELHRSTNSMVQCVPSPTPRF